MVENTASEGMSLEAIMNSTLGDLPELNPLLPAGTYTCKLKLAIKPVKGVNSIEAEFRTVEVIELDQANAAPPKAGSRFTMLYKSDNDIAMGRFRQILEEFSKVHQMETTADVLNGGPYDVMIVLKHRADSRDKNVLYHEVSKCSFI